MKYSAYAECKISITISTYNRPELLIRLLDSITGQKYSNYEIIIIDDNSTDHTEETVRHYKENHGGVVIRYYRNKKNRGVSFSKKRGYLLCRGDVIIFSDDDDYYTDDHYFAKVNSIYARHPDCTMTIASTLDHHEVDDSYTSGNINFYKPLDNIDFLNGFCSKYRKPGSMLTLTIHAEKMREIGFEKLKCFNDMSLYLYASLARGKVYPISEPVAVYSVQVGSMSSAPSAAYIIDNLQAKADIGAKALANGYINRNYYNRWLFNQAIPTLMHFYYSNIKSLKEYHQINKWAVCNLRFPYNFIAVARGIKARVMFTIQ